jgi:hypothetical protein
MRYSSTLKKPNCGREATVASKIPFHTLVQKIQTGKISEQEVARYFIVEPNSRRPFDYLVGINTSTVDITNVEESAIVADSLLRDATTVLDRQRASALKKKVSSRYKRKSPIIAEGDSWFKLPDLHWPPNHPLVPWTLIDFLQQKYSIINLAHWGDTLADMILVGQFWPYLMSGESDVLLFSAGGNDVLGGGELSRFLNLFDVDHDQPSDAPYYVKQDFYLNLEQIVLTYESLIRQIEIRTPHVIMIGHGYDYAIPQDDGPWLGSPMIRQGLYPSSRPKLCQGIIKVMIDAFNRKLKILGRQHSGNFCYADLRGTIKSNEWWDELHPLDAGARKTSAKIATALERLPASRIVSPPLSAARRRLVRLV